MAAPGSRRLYIERARDIQMCRATGANASLERLQSSRLTSQRVRSKAPPLLRRFGFAWPGFGLIWFDLSRAFGPALGRARSWPTGANCWKSGRAERGFSWRLVNLDCETTLIDLLAQVDQKCTSAALAPQLAHLGAPMAAGGESERERAAAAAAAAASWEKCARKNR